MFQSVTSRSRWFRLFALLLASVLILTACPADDEDVAATPDPDLEPQAGGELVVGLEAESNSWIPGESALASPGNTVAGAIFDHIMIRLPDGELVPYLAESVEPNDDFTEWTVTLRDGVQFHDGTDLTAEVIRANYDEHLIVDGANTQATLQRDVADLVVVDELTYTYQLNQANAAFPDILSGAIGRPFSIEAAREFGEDAGSNPVGTGPFQFVSWSRDDRLVVERNENYWRADLPYLDRITFRPIPDEETRVQSLLAGDIDVFQTLRQSTVVSARDAGDQVKLHEFIGNNSGGSIINTDVPPVDDVRVRQGLAWAINQEDLVEILGGVDITPVRTQYFTEDSIWHSEQVAEAWPDNDPARAQEILDEYVNDPNRSDGRGAGEPIAVEFNCPPDPSLIELSQAYQAFWNAVGVDVSLNQVDQATHIQNGLEGNYMINCWRVSGESDPYILWRDTFEEGNILNFTNYTSPVIEENLEILRTSDDFDTRFEAVEAISMHLAENVPLLYTGSTPVLFASTPDVFGLDMWTTPEGDQGGVTGVGDGGITLFTETWLNR